MLICEDSQEAAATERCLENEIRSVRSMKVAEIKRELSQRGLATEDMIEKEELVRCLAQARASEVRAPAESAAPENEVAQRHAKLCMDVSGLIRKGKFGGIAFFDSTLEEQVGCMDAPALRGMYAEHVMDAASSAAPFSPPNNPSLTCTPEGEFWYVVGKDGIDITKWEIKPGALPAEYDGCMVEGRNATPLSELLKADEAERAKLRDTELIVLRLYSGKKSFAGRRYGCPVVSIMLLLLHMP